VDDCPAMNVRLARVFLVVPGLALCLALVLGAAAGAVDIAPHRALYSMSLGSAKQSSGVVAASGTMSFAWGETCGGWTVEQRFRLRLEYADQDATEITSNLVTWESRDGSRYRFNEKRMRNGELDQRIKGEAHLNIPQAYLLGFDGSSAKLGTAARATIAQAAAASKREPDYHVMVISRTDTEAAVAPAKTTAKAEDERLSKRRAEIVRAELIHAGIPATSVQISAGAGPTATLAAHETRGKRPEHPVEILLEPSKRGGVAEFSKPEQATIALKPDVLFPTAHTLFLIDQAQAGVPFVVRQVFDGTTVDDATTISAAIGATLKPGEENASEHPIKTPLLDRPSWRMRLGFFPAESKAETPDYELGMRLMDNGVSQNMALDYGDYTVTAHLAHIEPLPKPTCPGP
ncbi:MAG: EipB family protein, partial [Stellaceae bacterium]